MFIYTDSSLQSVRETVVGFLALVSLLLLSLFEFFFLFLVQPFIVAILRYRGCFQCWQFLFVDSVTRALARHVVSGLQHKWRWKELRWRLYKHYYEWHGRFAISTALVECIASHFTTFRSSENLWLAKPSCLVLFYSPCRLSSAQFLILKKRIKNL